MSLLSRFIGRLTLWRKFAAVIVVLLPLIVLPCYLVVRDRLDTIDTARAEQAGIGPAQDTVALIEATQQLRWARARLREHPQDAAAAGMRDAASGQGSRLVQALRAPVAAYADEALSAALDQVTQGWAALGAAAGADETTVLRRHDDLVARELVLLDGITADSQLILDPEPQSYFLVASAYKSLPRLSEYLARAHVGWGRDGAPSEAVRSQLLADSIGARDNLEQTSLSLAQVGNTHAPGADAALQTSAGPQDAARRALQSIEERISATEGTDAGAAGLVEAAVGSQHRCIAELSRSLDAMLEGRIAAAREQMLLTFAGILVLAVLAGSLIVLIVRYATRSVNEGIALAMSLAQGDLSQQAAIEARDEFGRLNRAVQDAMAQLAQMVRNVRSASESVNETATQIARGSEDLAQRTGHQSHILVQAGEAMQQLGATVAANVQSTREGNDLAQGAVRVADQGGEMVARVVDTMSGINESSRRIEAIVSVIDGIAFQTNILALNAAVEAARAGEQGRGFAVVASEVRALAQRSADAARQIKGLIQGSVTRVDEGARLVDQAGATMMEIVASIRSLTAIIETVNNSSIEQAAEVAGTAASVRAMGESNSRNATLVEESTQAIEDLRRHADAMNTAVAVFKVPA